MSGDPWDAVIEVSGGDVETWSLHECEQRAQRIVRELHRAVEEHAGFAEQAVVAIREARVSYDSALLRSKVENDGFSVPFHEAWARQEATDQLFEKDLAEKLEQHHRKKVDALQSILIVIQSMMKNARALSGGQR